MDNFSFLGGTTLSDIQLQNLFDHMPVGITLLKAVREQNIIIDLQYVMLNPAARQHSQRGEKPGNYMLKEGADYVRYKRLREVIETGIDQSVSAQRNVYGSERWFSESFFKFGDGVIIYTQDITEQKKTELRIAQDNRFVNQLADLSADIIYILDLETTLVIYTNRSIVEKLGYSKKAESQMKNPLLDLMHDEDKPRMMIHLRKMRKLKDNEVIEIDYRMMNASGGYQWFCDRDTVFKRNKAGIPVEKLGICQDITVRKEQEEQKRINQGIIQQVEEIVDIGAWEYDLRKKEFKWTEGMYKLFNIPAGTPVTPAIYLDHTDEKDKELVIRIVEQIVTGIAPIEATFTLLPHMQESKVVRIKAMSQNDKNGVVVKMIGVDLDITAQVKISCEIKELNRTLEKGNSELQEMNNEIRVFNNIAVQDYKDTLKQLYMMLEYVVSNEVRRMTDSGRANVRRAQAAVQKLNLLTDDINEYFHLYDQEFEFTKIDPNTIVSEIVATVHAKLQQHNASIVIDDIPVLQSNHELLTRLLMNLVSNSIRFRNAMAPLVIRVRYAYADELNSIPAAMKNTPYHILSVADNGLGFNEDEAERIFDLFYKTPAKIGGKSSGVGLAVCRKIMKMHDGFITAESTLARGATFNCYFPVRDAV